MITITTSPSGLPVELSEVKRQLGVTDDEHDTDIERLIHAAAKDLENRTGRTVLQTGYTFKRGGFPPESCPIVLPAPPTSSVTSVNYRDTSGSDTTYTGWQLDNTPESFSLLYPQIGQLWPETQYGRVDAVTIVYVGGYADQDSVPELVRQYISVWCRNQFDNADGYLSKQVSEGLKSLAHSLSVGRYVDTYESPY